MSDSSEQWNKKLEARDNRRWLIGVGISVAFGLFGVVMALLSYSRHSSSAATAAPTPAAGSPAQRAAGTRDRDAPRRRK